MNFLLLNFVTLAVLGCQLPEQCRAFAGFDGRSGTYGFPNGPQMANGFANSSFGLEQIDRILNRSWTGAGSPINPLNITREDMDKIARVLTAGCYSDINMVPMAIARCVGTSVVLINQLLSLLAHEVIGVYFTSSQEWKEQSSCFVRGLGLLNEDGSLSEAGLQQVLSGIQYDTDLRTFIAEGVTSCTSPDKETHDLNVCIEHALLIRCKIPESTL